MSKEEKEAIAHLEWLLDSGILASEDEPHVETVLNLIQKQKAEIETLECNYEILQGEMDRIGIDTLKLEPGNSTDDVIEEIKKKDKILNWIKDYAQQEINFRTEDIRDYLDDDKEGNKNIIDELKEDREHWRDIIRIMNDEKTYMDF